jgi:hypothetical protein
MLPPEASGFFHITWRDPLNSPKKAATPAAAALCAALHLAGAVE